MNEHESDHRRRFATSPVGIAVVTALVVIGVSLFVDTPTLAADPLLEKQDLFVVGEDPAYSLYHIPGIVVTAKGSVLAWCEARKRAAGVSDWDDIRILLRRSTDDVKRGVLHRALRMSKAQNERTHFRYG